MKGAFFLVLAACSTFSSAAVKGNVTGTIGVVGTSGSTGKGAGSFVDSDTGSTYKHFDCGTDMNHASDHFKQNIASLHAKDKKGKVGSRAPAMTMKRAKLQAQANIPAIDTYFHVVSSTAKNGTITQAMVTKQIAALNKAYNAVGISFTLKGTDWSVNDAWAVGAGADMAAMKSALRKGTYRSLNVYFQTDLLGNILGTCSLPAQVSAGMPPSLYASDGCNVQANTMPGGNIYGYNAGKTTVHEVGHWLGLLHTFEGYSCTGTGDFISDTPMEAVSTDGCPRTPAKNSCPSVNDGVDPIHNYMDYSTDACYTSFTAGQVSRMSTMWTQYRNGM